MKNFLLLAAAAWFGLSLTIFSEKTYLTGTAKDAETGEQLIGAAIQIFSKDILVAKALTDFEGKFRIEIAPGRYDVQCSYTGFESIRVVEVDVLEGKENPIDFLLKSGAELSEVVVTSKRVTHIVKESRSSGITLEESSASGSAKKSTRKRDAAPAKSKAEVTHYDAVMMAKPAAEMPASAPADYSKPVLKESEIATFAGEADDKKSADAPPIPGAGQPAPRAGLLTGGEWNDLNNWSKHWTDLLADGEIEAFQNMYKFYPKHRFSVLLQNENGYPASDAVVRLFEKNGTQVWQSRTDNNGKAELWYGMFERQAEAKNLRLEVEFRGKKTDLGAAKVFAEGINRHTLSFDCQASKNVDIVWAVDATGSMGDEIEYLKTELLDVINRVKNRNPDLALRMGTVFYRDKTDDYITKSSGLNTDIERTVEFIRKQYADGGGDYPEAVHSALEEAVFKMDWQADAVARICFLVLDASPHQQPEVIESMQKSIREAAARGIRVVPLSASGIQKDTEFLMKFFGLATNGTYTFLTDHSGIGGKHLEPTSDEYKIESVNDLLVRIITEYTTTETCEGQSAIVFDGQTGEGQPKNAWKATYFPNPANDQFTLDLPVDVQSVTIYNAEGQAVRKLTGVKSGRTPIVVSDLAEGFYTIRILKDNEWQSGKLMVVRA